MKLYFLDEIHWARKSSYSFHLYLCGHSACIVCGIDVFDSEGMEADKEPERGEFDTYQKVVLQVDRIAQRIKAE